MTYQVVNGWLASGSGGALIAAARLRFPDGTLVDDGNGRIHLQEIEFLDALGGTDQCNGGTPFASSNFGGLWTEANCFDNNTSGVDWLTAGGGHYNSHIGYTFAAPIAAIPQFTVRTNSGANSHPATIMLEVQYDGSSNWTRLAEINGLSWTAGETKTFTTADYPATPMAGYRYWKIEIDASNDGNGDVLAAEIELRATAGGADQTSPNATGQASGTAGFYDAGESPPRAFNNNTGDWWQPRLPGGGGTVHCIWDFGAGNDRQINQIRWIAHGSFLGRTPSQFRVYGSANGSSWTEDWAQVICGAWATADRTFNRA